MTSSGDHITVCVCTYKRPLLLQTLLQALENQEGGNLFTYSVVVADNDCEMSGKNTVRMVSQACAVDILYVSEPEQNIALARNKAVAEAGGTYVAFIDDDETPAADWLVVMYKLCRESGADGVLGSVIPRFEEAPPDWVRKGHFFDRPTHPTGHVLDWKNTRTGNVLLRRDLFEKGGAWFDPAFGSGGEDRDFFRRKIEEGRRFLWCNEGVVFETIPPKRWEKKVLLKRALIRGRMAVNSPGSRSVNVLKSLTAILAYGVFLPFSLIGGRHVFMKYLIKSCDHIGKVLGMVGTDLVKEKYIGG